MKYTFAAFGKEFEVEADNVYGVVWEQGDAMAIANKDFLWQLPEFIKDSNGSWFDKGPGSYVWVSGDYFN